MGPWVGRGTYTWYIRIPDWGPNRASRVHGLDHRVSGTQRVTTKTVPWQICCQLLICSFSTAGFADGPDLQLPACLLDVQFLLHPLRQSTIFQMQTGRWHDCIRPRDLVCMSARVQQPSLGWGLGRPRQLAQLRSTTRRNLVQHWNRELPPTATGGRPTSHPREAWRQLSKVAGTLQGFCSVA